MPQFAPVEQPPSSVVLIIQSLSLAPYWIQSCYRQLTTITAPNVSNSSKPPGRKVRLTADQWRSLCEIATKVANEHPLEIRENLDIVVDEHFGHQPIAFGDLYGLIRSYWGADKNVVAERVYRIIESLTKGSERFQRNFAIVLTDMTSNGWCPINGHEKIHGVYDNMASAPAISPYIPQTGPSMPNIINSWSEQHQFGMPHPMYCMPHMYGQHPMEPQFRIWFNAQGQPTYLPGMMPPFAQQGGQAPSVPPASDPLMPAASLANSSGGTGMEPGFNYFYVSEHVRIFILRSKYPPWQVNDNSQINVTANFVPGNVTIGELMRGFGCDNPEPKNNRVTEIVPGGSGNWYKGLSISGASKELLKKSIREVGWDGARGDLPGGEESPGVYLWFCK